MIRRRPPPFLAAEVVGSEHLTPHMVRVALAGPALLEMEPPGVAASVRVLLHPDPMPAWNGNEFLLPDGTRPVIRTLTPCRFDARTGRLDVEVVLHPGGAASAWAAAAAAGGRVAVSGPGRGYTVDVDADAYVIAGDETAIPAMLQVVDAVAPIPYAAVAEIGTPDARQDRLAAEWCESGGMLDRIRALAIGERTAFWVAGEAAGVQRIRKHLFDERGVARARATVRGYWKRGGVLDE